MDYNKATNSVQSKGQRIDIKGTLLLVAVALYAVGTHLTGAETVVRQQQAWNLSKGDIREKWAKVMTAGSDRLTFLPPETVAMIVMLERQGDEGATYRLSSDIRANALVAQRMIEGALPAKYSEQAALLFLLENEVHPQGCSVIDSAGGITLARCV